MGFFSDLKEDLSQAVNELMPEEELDQAAVEETKEQPVNRPAGEKYAGDNGRDSDGAADGRDTK